ncbi:hypothetical protein [Amycolatopsis sp. DSM 110486]|uniref:hypothetical protein n=1 Tax=Amycolatopsis sp. DSM 110486 TaxID=2865832 RepID=UPI001C6959A1|nr:hypothetical protein [Amycolatopsis sp. DSM 110486]QYN21468.1 hypothetical protein K1T34_02610 [Amycolatopsis sp. DSM 110486]
MDSNRSPEGQTGVLLIGTRGPAGPGEVLLRIRGGTETYRAYSEVPLAKGTTVLVVESLPHRAVEVIAWTDPFTSN